MRSASMAETPWTLHPYLEPVDFPRPGLWYVISAEGQPPTPRVGPGCCVWGHAQLVVFGGANPGGGFSDLHQLDVVTHTWQQLETRGESPSSRYEHAMQTVREGAAIAVVGGCGAEGNLNDVYLLDRGRPDVLEGEGEGALIGLAWL